MRRKLILLALAAVAAPAAAGMPVSQTMKCPIGGKSFSYTTTASYSIWGYRLDGKPYGSWEFPLELPKCPDNGLVLFDQFEKDDLERLEPLIASAEYRAMAETETNYYLAAWLMEKIGREPINAAWMLVQASWQADGRPETKARYQALYVDKIRALPRSGDGVDWLIMQARAVNGLRELGRFDEAKALLASLDLKPLDVPIPKEKSEKTPSGLGRTISNFEAISEAKRKRDFLFYFERMGKLLDARVSHAEPLHTLPIREAADRCRDARDSLPQTDKDFCESEAMRKYLAR